MFEDKLVLKLRLDSSQGCHGCNIFVVKCDDLNGFLNILIYLSHHLTSKHPLLRHANLLYILRT